ncbi:hypothetical protein PoB_006283800 [Plakobranchus ocellatus]|uniref:NADH dehydrogenase subunit 6 n=1 Tax=Plakobranchus ocellatus TaxID=259542 RepID=A0AAV4CWR5_9GAST|nr:hypothetical protein PoB_006283800 [Plakobranchus ocellatus]
MGCAVCCKVLLILINIVTMILSLAFIAIGVLLVFVVDIFLEDAFESAKEDAATRNYVITGSASELKEFPLLYEIGVAFLVFGALLFVLSWLAWCGSCCASCCRILLLVFSVILIVLMLAEVIVLSLFLVKDSAVSIKQK